MHDLKQLAKDAERVEASAKAWLSECEGLDREEVEYHEAVHRLAAFACDLTDETPVDEAWLAKVSPRLADGRCVFIWNAHLLEYDDDFDILSLRAPYTRGRVRAFAFGMGLTLMEGGR